MKKVDGHVRTALFSCPVQSEAVALGRLGLARRWVVGWLQVMEGSRTSELMSASLASAKAGCDCSGWVTLDPGTSQPGLSWRAIQRLWACLRAWGCPPGTRAGQWAARALVEEQPWSGQAGLALALTVHTAACRMASKPPSGASRLPEILSFSSLFRNSAKFSVRLMTFLKEKGGSLLGHGSFSLGRGGGRERQTQGRRLHLPLRPPYLEVPLWPASTRTLVSALAERRLAPCPGPLPIRSLTSRASCPSEGR